MSEFGGLNVALSALMSQRRGLEVTGNNVANANTEGYSRQRVNLAAVGGPITGTFFSRPNGVGNGVNVQSVTRFRDAFLEISGALERGASGQLKQSSSVLGQIEALFAEPSDQSIAKNFNDFWAGWDDVANHPSDAASRDQLLQRGATLAASLNHASDQLGEFRSEAISQLTSLTTDVNTMASNIASLNSAIRSATTNGADASSLQDQRDLLVQQLSEKVGGTVRYGDNNMANIYVGGTALVDGDTTNALQVDTSGSSVALRWTVNGTAATVPSGNLGGLLGVINTTLPSYSSGLDAVAVQLRNTVNSIHQAGAGLDGVTGRKFFDGTGAADLAISADIGTNTDHIAAGATGSGTLDGSVAQNLADLATSSTGPDASYHSYIVNLGVESQSAQRRSQIQDATVAQIDNERDANSSVSTDEEMVSLVQYQHAYEAASRYLTTVDQVLDQLINRTGTVGR